MIRVIEVCKVCGCIIKAYDIFNSSTEQNVRANKNETLVWCNTASLIKIRIKLGICYKCIEGRKDE